MELNSIDLPDEIKTIVKEDTGTLKKLQISQPKFVLEKHDKTKKTLKVFNTFWKNFTFCNCNLSYRFFFQLELHLK